MSLRIAYISSTFPDYKKCGIGIYAGYLTQSLSELNHEVHVITTAIPEIRNAFGKVHVHKIMQKWGLLEAPRLMQELMQIKPQIIHINHPTQIAGAKSAFLVNMLPEINRAMGLATGRIPVVTTIHEFVNNSFLGKMKVLPLIAGSDVVTVTSEFYKKGLKKYLSESAMTKIEVVDIGNIFDRRFEQLPEEKSEQRKKWTLKSEDKVIGFTGFLTPPKGFHYLVEAFAKLNQKDPNYKLLALSSWNLSDVFYKEKILNLIEKYKLQNKIIFSGYLDDENLWKAMGAIDLCVYPFDVPVEERSSGVLRQALARGIPTMTYAKDINYTEFGLKNMENIWLTPFGDIDALVYNIEKFFSETQYASQLSAGGIKLRQALSFENVANQMSRIYSKLV